MLKACQGAIEAALKRKTICAAFMGKRRILLEAGWPHKNAAKKGRADKNLWTNGAARIS